MKRQEGLAVIFPGDTTYREVPYRILGSQLSGLGMCERAALAGRGGRPR